MVAKTVEGYIGSLRKLRSIIYLSVKGIKNHSSLFIIMHAPLYSLIGNFLNVK